MSFPSIGVVTPSFNQSKFIGRTIDSVLSQQYPNLEYWVIDGGSTDGTQKILETYGSRIRWISEKDNGQSEAINKGLKRLSTDIVCFLNSDDVFVSGCLFSVAVKYGNPGFDWLIGSYEIIDGSDRIITSQSFIPRYKEFLLRHYSPNILKSVNSIVPQPSTFWSRRIQNTVGFLNESLKYTMDYDYWLRMSAVCTPLITDEVYSRFRIHTGSKSGSQYRQQFSEELSVLKSHGCNPAQYAVHWLHTAATLFMYSILK